jgi:hypothetical protein
MSAVNLNSMRVAATDKLIIQHLAEGGAIDDNKGCELVNALVRHGLNDKRMGASAAARRLTHSDFVFGYQESVKALFPDILVSQGVEIIIPSLLFTDNRYFDPIAAVFSKPDAYGQGSLVEAYVALCRSILVEARALGRTLPFPTAAEYSARIAKRRRTETLILLVCASVGICLTAMIIW